MTVLVSFTANNLTTKGTASSRVSKGITRYNQRFQADEYGDFNQQFIRIHLLYTHQFSLDVKELYLNAKHKLITLPAPSGGLLTMTVIFSERPTLIVSVPSQGIHRRICSIGADEYRVSSSG